MTLLILIISFLVSVPFGPASNPASATCSMEYAAKDTIRLVFDVNISQGWHVYSTNLPSGGPNSTQIMFDSIYGLKPVDDLKFSGTETEQFDPVFGINIRFFERKVRFYQDLHITSPDWSAQGYLSYSICNDSQCLPPQKVEFSYGSSSVTPPPAPNEQSGLTDLSQLKDYSPDTWAPVSINATNMDRTSLWGLFLTSFLGGLLALLTPCVWPIIPMTVSFFIKRSSNRKKAVLDALTYGLSIIAVYVAIGLGITLVFGANALNALSTNAIVNILFFLILVFFALSFFGVFQITLPAGWSTGTERKASGSGFWGIFFMALTLTIVSFSCTGPIIGFLLVDAASSGSIIAPVVGMAGFSMAMAIPFALFAMFPGWLQSLPKSGSWMDKVKVTLGFVELAFSLKFLSVADMAYGWGILPRDLFILLWIIMAILLGLYLMGLTGKKQNGNKRRFSIAGTVTGISSLAFAAWLVPGLWGAPLKAISAFTPPVSTQIIGHNLISVEPQYTDYNQALKASELSGKPVLIDFTGYGCVNCRKMEASVWTDRRVAEIINGQYILTSLFVDDKTPIKENVWVTENGTKVKIRTVGDKWSLLQRYKFGANAQPFYVIVDSKGNLQSGPYTFDPNVENFLNFLK